MRKTSFGLCVVYKYSKAIPSDLSVDRFNLQGREFLGHHQKEGVRAKEMGTLRGPDLNSTTFEDRKIYQGKSTFSHFKFNLWILLYLS